MIKTQTAEVITAATLVTSAYAGGWVSDWVSMAHEDHVSLALTFTTADATTFQVTAEVEDATGANGYTTLRISSGTASIDETTITPAAPAATERYELAFYAAAPRRMRLRAKKTGGSGAPTLALAVMRGRAA